MFCQKQQFPGDIVQKGGPTSGGTFSDFLSSDDSSFEKLLVSHCEISCNV